jgi:hypothetical protein
MSIPGTFAANQPLPAKSPYGVNLLDTYGTVTRASAAAAGIPAANIPPYNPSLPVKNWLALDVDDTVPNVFYALQEVAQGETSPARL